MSAALAALLRGLLPPGIGCGSADAALPLWPGETLTGAVPARLAEFALGRTAARRALVAAGLTPVAIPIGADRAPVWPTEATGSVSHAAGACLALAGSRALWDGLGIDVEPVGALSPDLWPEVLGKDERLALPAMEADLAALRVFTAKEAVYKAQHAVTGRLFGFHTLHVMLEAERFAARFTEDVAPFAKGTVLRGKHLVTATHVVAVTWIDPENAGAA